MDCVRKYLPFGEAMLDSIFNVLKKFGVPDRYFQKPFFQIRDLSLEDMSLMQLATGVAKPTINVDITFFSYTIKEKFVLDFDIDKELTLTPCPRLRLRLSLSPSLSQNRNPI